MQPSPGREPAGDATGVQASEPPDSSARSEWNVTRALTARRGRPLSRAFVRGSPLWAWRIVSFTLHDAMGDSGEIQTACACG